MEHITLKHKLLIIFVIIISFLFISNGTILKYETTDRNVQITIMNEELVKWVNSTIDDSFDLNTVSYSKHLDDLKSRYTRTALVKFDTILKQRHMYDFAIKDKVFLEAKCTDIPTVLTYQKKTDNTENWKISVVMRMHLIDDSSISEDFVNVFADIQKSDNIYKIKDISF